MILYIAGYGRSGSTVLELLFSQEVGTTCLGEIVRVDKFGASNSYCTCGKKITDCESFAWCPSGHAKAFSGKVVFLWFAFLFLLGFRKNLSSTAPEIVNYFNGQMAVDSSKSTFYSFLRPFEYSRSGGDVRVIFNCRSLFSTFKSLLKGSNSDLASGSKLVKAKALVFFVPRVANLIIFGRLPYYVYKAFFGSRVVRVNYEEWVDDPKEMLLFVSNEFSLDMSVALKAASEGRLLVKHAVAGNRVRAEMCGRYIELSKK